MSDQRQLTAPPQEEPLPTLASQLWDLVVRYIKQETLEPIKGLGRFVAFGLAGAVALGIGMVILVLAGLRALETETGGALDGNWSWAPYLITLVVAGGGAGLAVRAIWSHKRRAATRGSMR